MVQELQGGLSGAEQLQFPPKHTGKRKAAQTGMRTCSQHLEPALDTLKLDRNALMVSLLS